MGEEFFIMMDSKSGKSIMPLVDDDDEVLLFDTYDGAKFYADDHPWASKFGYEIFQRGDGLVF